MQMTTSVSSAKVKCMVKLNQDMVETPLIPVKNIALIIMA